VSTTFIIRTQYGDHEIARRVSGKMVWLNSLAPFLDSSLPVIPIDNTAQGIHTVEDIHYAMETGDICPDQPRSGYDML